MRNVEELRLEVAEADNYDRARQLHAMHLQREQSILNDLQLRRTLAAGLTSIAALAALILAGLTAWHIISGPGHDRWLIGMMLTTITLLLRLIYSLLPAILANLGRR